TFAGTRELLLPDWNPSRPRRSQLEGGLSTAIREGRLRPDTRLPSTRALAAELGVSRRLVVDAYEQLVAEGHLVARRGSGTKVAPQPPGPPQPAPTQTVEPSPQPGVIDLFAGAPEAALFPRRAWSRALRRAVETLADSRLSYGEFGGAEELRLALAEHLGRVRGAAVEPGQIVATSGYQQGLRIFCQLIRSRGGRRVAVEDPGYPIAAWTIESEQLDAVPIPVDDRGVDVDALVSSEADAAVVIPAHSMPLGVALAPERRRELAAWARERGTLVLEDDYDAELRYDRGPTGCLQGLAPDVVVLAGSVSKTLAPTLRLGWLCLPGDLVAPAMGLRAAFDGGGTRFVELAFAELLSSGAFDRHIRASRQRYRSKRSLLLDAVASELPGARLGGIAGGLHAVLELPPGSDEKEVTAAAGRAGVKVQGLGDYILNQPRPPSLVIGYGPPSDRELRRAVGIIAEAVSCCRR
ncbi:MAG TPA: PLP-dependent aminotransferase family protein, partial [Solirubrobacterales bacterium]|nr:PLP-dependent aminotransferase family protein [Solirubrobacterales bacterium]